MSPLACNFGFEARMHWDDTVPRPAINFGAAFGVLNDPTLFRVCILRVLEADPLAPAFEEFWRRVLVEGPAECSDRWEVLLLKMNLLGGGFTCVFTDRGLERDEPPVFKFSAEVIEAECYALPEREPGDPRAKEDYQALEERCIEQLRTAARAEPVATLLRGLRDRHTFAVTACDFYRTKQWPLDI